MPKILIVDDFKQWQNSWKRRLGDKVEILSAFTIPEADALFSANPDINLIVMDACVPGDELTTPPLVRKFRETFKGPMIAVSSDEEYRKELMRVGCDHESEKEHLPKKVLEILGI